MLRYLAKIDSFICTLRMDSMGVEYLCQSPRGLMTN